MTPQEFVRQGAEILAGQPFSRLLGVEIGAVAPGRVEATAAKMIAAGRLAASLDQVDGVLHFHATQDALDSFDESIKALCLGVNACYEHAEQLAA